MIEVALLIALLVAVVAFDRELRLRRRTQVALADATGQLEQSRAAQDRALDRAEARAEEAKEVARTLEYIADHRETTEYNGIPIYRWTLTSPYPTLTEAQKHAPDNW